ncbi:putative extracellular solute-binding protein precursor, putative sulfonate-binding protein precursor [Methylorubrum extorquens]|uniref:Putative extracellular solute-binding protein, putative sulfonate-binding protein n=2 Tax=Methylorubrum extorquens TaxID=408 RepID=A0A2N9ANT0_METEX|nr:putative extracellular solute-binding protein precursor, putative sulfonate-binding protein precursor [Methylorubrum extorquens]
MNRSYLDLANKRTIMSSHFIRWAILLFALFGASGAALAQGQAQTLPVRIGAIPVLGAAPLFVAEREGWLGAGGLKPTVTLFDSGPNAVQAAASGTVDVYVAGITPVAIGRTRGVDLRVVAATAIGENVLVAGAKLAGPLTDGTAPAAAFRRFREETGRPAKIATQPPGSIPYTNLSYWLREVHKVDPADVQILTLGIDAAQQAILAGAVEAATVREPGLSIIRERNPQIRLVANGSELFPGQPGTVVAVRGAFLEQNPAAVRTLVSAIVRAVDLIKRDPERALPAVEAALGKGIVTAATLRNALASPATQYVADPRTIVAATGAMLALQTKLGISEQTPPTEGLFDSRFFEAAQAEASAR